MENMSDPDVRVPATGRVPPPVTTSGLPDDWLEAANLHATVAQLLSTVIHQVNNALQETARTRLGKSACMI